LFVSLLIYMQTFFWIRGSNVLKMSIFGFDFKHFVFYWRHGQGGWEPDFWEQRTFSDEERAQHRQGRSHRKGRWTHRVSRRVLLLRKLIKNFSVKLINEIVIFELTSEYLLLQWARDLKGGDQISAGGSLSATTPNSGTWRRTQESQGRRRSIENNQVRRSFQRLHNCHIHNVLLTN